MCVWGGEVVCCQTFLLFSFPCSTDHERDWPPCKRFFFGLTTNHAECENNREEKYLEAVDLISYVGTIPSWLTSYFLV